MDYNKTYVCKKCKTVYDDLPDNGDGEHQCGNCLNSGCFEENESMQIDSRIQSIIYQFLDVMKDLDNCLSRLLNISKQIMHVQSDLLFSLNNTNKKK